MALLNIWFKFLCVDQSCALTTVISWLFFLGLGVLVPVLSYLSCSNPYDAAAQLALTTIAILSFISLSIFHQMNGTVDIRADCNKQFKRSIVTLFTYVLPCFAVEAAYKIWQYSDGSKTWLLGSVVELASWFYRTMIFFLVCVLFRLVSTLHILRIHAFVEGFCDHDIQSVLREHFIIRRNLKSVCQGFRFFILSSLLFITASQFSSLHLISRSKSNLHIHDIGELTVCFVTLSVGLLMILTSASRITKKTKDLTSFVAKWHLCSTSEPVETRVVSDEELICLNEVEHDEDDLDRAEFVGGDTPMSFQDRKNLVAYFENSPAGITVFDFTLDRILLMIMFGIELSLGFRLMGEIIFITL